MQDISLLLNSCCLRTLFALEITLSDAADLLSAHGSCTCLLASYLGLGGGVLSMMDMSLTLFSWALFDRSGPSA
jgi:hypothetical protein